jgi:hypothetical protein
MELAVELLRLYRRVALDVQPYNATLEQSTTIKTGTKTIRHTIYLCKKQALEYRRYQITLLTWNWLPRSYDRTPLGCVKNFHKTVLNMYSTDSH